MSPLLPSLGKGWGSTARGGAGCSAHRGARSGVIPPLPHTVWGREGGGARCPAHRGKGQGSRVSLGGEGQGGPRSTPPPSSAAPRNGGPRGCPPAPRCRPAIASTPSPGPAGGWRRMAERGRTHPSCGARCKEEAAKAHGAVCGAEVSREAPFAGVITRRLGLGGGCVTWLRPGEWHIITGRLGPAAR